MTLARKMFMSQVVLPPSTATSLLTLMQNAPLHWTYETTALTTPSMDSITGSECGIVPDLNVCVGVDSNVRDATSGSNYRGVLAAAGTNFSLQDFGSADGIIDPNAIYFYSSPGCNMDVVFTAR